MRGYANLGEQILVDLVYFLYGKNIDIKQHLNFDTSKNGRLNNMYTIIELKTSFIENDNRELIKKSKQKDGGDIIIDELV